MIQMVKNGLIGEICHAIHRYAKVNSKYTKSYNKNKESLYLRYLNPSNLYEWKMSQKLPWTILNGKKTHKNLMNRLSKIMMKIVMKNT